jgi:hypothetical protein
LLMGRDRIRLASYPPANSAYYSDRLLVWEDAAYIALESSVI